MIDVLAAVFFATCMTVNRATASPITARSGWSPLGCFIDNVSGRALSNGAAIPGGTTAMTNEACQTACLAAGFSIAGTEHAGECCKDFSLLQNSLLKFLMISGCSNAIVNGGGPAPELCNMACKRDNTETYGGPNGLDVYQYASSGPATGPAKRGLVYNNNNPSSNAEYANLFKGYSKISWGYDWGYPSQGLDPSFELQVAFSSKLLITD